MVDAVPVQRIVPGAPAPLPVSKSQKKKRKAVPKPRPDDAPASVSIPDSTAAALVEQAPEPADIKQGAVAEELVAAPQELLPEMPAEKPKSPTIEFLNKRIKLQTKKISRIATYSSKPDSALNEDQKKSVASLPSIHAVVRELEEMRKTIEAIDAEEAKRSEAQRIEDEQAANARITQAVATATATLEPRVSLLLSILRLASALAGGDPTTFNLVINDAERNAIYSLAQILTGTETSRKEESIVGIVSVTGEFDGITYSRLLEIVETFRNSPPEAEPTPIPIVEEEVAQEILEAPAESEHPEQPTPVVESAPHAAGSFHFMQESELEAPSFEDGAEWVEKPREIEVEVPVTPVEAPSHLILVDNVATSEVSGFVPPMEEPPATAVSASLDWAADDGEGLPSINSLHAKFGTSGAATPEASAQDTVPVTDGTTPAPVVNGHIQEVHDASPEVDEDGFVKAKSGRGKQTMDSRGRGRGGFRGDRGGPRGGYRGRGGSDSFGGGWRGDGGRGGFRGDGGRGAFRGDRGRGEFRGGRGDYRGRGRGNWGGKASAEAHAEQSS